MTTSTKSIAASALIAVVCALIWFGAPPLPAVTGAVLAAAFLYWRSK